LALVEGNLNANGYQDIIENSLWPVVSKIFFVKWLHFSGWQRISSQGTFYHRIQAPKQNKVAFLAAQSPRDLNITENVWLQLINTLQRNTDTITWIEQLKAAITTAWTNLRHNYIQAV